ncbi:MAG: hypothetical protein R3B70_36125 [Polyangiaceae bacterium]
MVAAPTGAPTPVAVSAPPRISPPVPDTIEYSPPTIKPTAFPR